jgi:putative SOS response-associated peptidase YedK
MCGRFTLFESGQILSKMFGAPLTDSPASRYNIAPSQPVLVVRCAPESGRREFALTRWGLVPSWAKDPAIGNRLINARAETAHEKPAFRAAFRSRRCLIPASGFYEWQRLEKKKQPYFIRMQDGRPFAFAGLWEHWEGPDGSAIETCAILTTGSNAVITPVHDRMPVIIGPGNYDRWLDPADRKPESLNPLLVPYDPEGMIAYPVSPRVNSPANDDKGCIASLS